MSKFGKNILVVIDEVFTLPLRYSMAFSLSTKRIAVQPSCEGCKYYLKDNIKEAKCKRFFTIDEKSKDIIYENSEYAWRNECRGQLYVKNNADNLCK